MRTLIAESALDFQADSACSKSGLPDNIDFFASDQHGQELAKAVCNTCPVKKQCLEYAMEYKEPFGIWGGMTENERRSYHRRMIRHKREGKI